MLCKHWAHSGGRRALKSLLGACWTIDVDFHHLFIGYAAGYFPTDGFDAPVEGGKSIVESVGTSVIDSVRRHHI